MDRGLAIQELQAEALGIVQRDEERIHALKLRAKMIIGKVFSPSSHYLKELENIHFNPSVLTHGMEAVAFETAWQNGKSQFLNLCRTMVEDLDLGEFKQGPKALDAEVAPNPPRKKDYKVIITGDHHEPGEKPSKKVFIVHGHDSEMKEAVARTLSKLGLDPVILHEQPDQGRTVIEKFVEHSDVGFAIVLLSGDDVAFPKSAKSKEARPRARQNVILELGFFLGKLGRSKVLPLYRRVGDFELPSDFAGVLYKEFDDKGAWKLELFRELRAAGYQVDANKLM